MNSWWWAEELPETCRVSCRSKYGKMVHLVGFIIKKFVTMHGHMNVKFISLRFACWLLCGTLSKILQISTISNQVSPWTPIIPHLILTLPSIRHSTIPDNNEEQNSDRTGKSRNRDTAPCFICYHLSILSDVPSDWRLLIKLGHLCPPRLYRSYLSSWHRHLSR